MPKILQYNFLTSQDANICGQKAAILKITAQARSLSFTLYIFRYSFKQNWAFFTNNIDKISKRYTGGLFLMARLIKGVTESFSCLESWKEICETFAENKEKFLGAETAVEQACERVRLNAAWRAKDIDNLKRFLQSDEACIF